MNDVDEKQLTYLLDISHGMAENRALEPLLNYAMRSALRLLNAERGYLVLLDDDGALEFRVKIDYQGSELAQPDEQISHSILNRAIQQGEPIIINDAMLDPSLAKAESVKTLQLRSVMCGPLQARGRIIGAVYVENRSRARVFNEADKEPFMFFARQAAVAIENAMLNDELERRVAERTRELEEANTRLEQSWTKAVGANRIRTIVLGNVAHDMRAPISLSISALSALREGLFGELNDDQLEWVDRALQSMQHAIDLTTDIFVLMRAEMGELVIYPQQTDLQAFLQEIHDIGEGIPWSEGTQFALDLQTDLPQVLLDPIRIKQVVLNLLSNAQKYTEDGSVTLYARYNPGDEHVLIGVRDTGTGIPPDQLHQIFDRFRQGTQKDDTLKSGTGLGLAICKELVALHGGRIWAESEPGQGAEFKLTLPLHPPVKES